MIPHLGPAARSRRVAVREREELVVARLQALAPELDGEPNPDFQATTRARLVAMAAVRPPAAEPVSPLTRLLTAPESPARWRSRLTAGLAAAALTVTVLAGVVALSTDAGPGDLLYGVKRGTEETQLALASDARRGQTLLDLASTRLAELDALLGGGDADPALVAETLATMDEQTREGAAWQARRAVQGSDAAPLEELAAWRHSQSQGLLALRPEIPAAATVRYTASLALLDEVGRRADGLENSLQCPAGPATEGADALGPKPAPCAPLQAPPPGTSTGSGGTPSAPGGAGGNPSTGAGGGTGDPGGGSSAGSSGEPPGGPDTSVETPELPTTGLPTLPTPTLPVPTLPAPTLPQPGTSGGLLPGQEQEPAPSGGLLPCLPPLGQLTC